MSAIPTAVWIAIGLCCLVGSVFGLIRLAAWVRERRMANARQQFYTRREWLEAEFLKLAGLRGIPRGLTWVDCDFDDEVAVCSRPQ